MKLTIRLLTLTALVLSAVFAALYFARPSSRLDIAFPEPGAGKPASQTANDAAALAPPVLVATAGSDRITISWAPVVGAASYEIWGRQGDDDPWERLDDGSLTHNVTSLTHSGLTSGDTYTYTGRAAPAAGELSDWAGEIEATVSHIPTLSAAASAGRIELSWTSVAGAGSYQLIMWTDGLKDWERIGDPITGATTSYIHTGLTELNTYHYRVRAVIDEEEGEYSDSVSEIPVRPAAPTLTAAADTGQIELNWTAITDAESYRLITWTDGQTAWVRIGDPLSSTTTSYTHTGLVAGRTYYYRVSAVIHGIEGAWTESVSGIPAAPPAPVLTASASIGQVDLSWTAVTDAGGHILIVWTDAQNAWVRIGDPLSSTTTSYTHTGLVAGRTYYYRVSAVIHGIEGAWTESVSGIPAAPPAPVLTASASIGQVDLSWTAVTDAGGHILIVWTDAQNAWVRIGDPLSGDTTSYTHTGLSAGQTYYYRVAAVVDGTEGVWSNSPSVVPGATFMPGLVANASAHRIDLSWSEVTGADGYQLIVWTPGQTGWERVGGDLSAGTKSHAHTDLTAGNTYYYRVRAVIDGVEGPWSEEVDAVP
jgi:titin